MSFETYLQASEEFALDKYRATLPQDAIAFSGVPRKHPYDAEKVLLFCDPLSKKSKILEFRIIDIVSAEDLPSPVTEEGESLNIVKLWVRRGSYGMQYEPFEVAEPLAFLRDSNLLHDKLLRSLKNR